MMTMRQGAVDTLPEFDAFREVLNINNESDLSLDELLQVSRKSSLENNNEVDFLFQESTTETSNQETSPQASGKMPGILKKGKAIKKETNDALFKVVKKDQKVSLPEEDACSESTDTSNDQPKKKRKRYSKLLQMVQEQDLDLGTFKKERKRMQNRISAFKCRQRKKEYVDTLEDKNKELEDSNMTLEKQNVTLKSENEKLREQLRAIEQMMLKAQSQVNFIETTTDASSAPTQYTDDLCLKTEQELDIFNSPVHENIDGLVTEINQF